VRSADILHGDLQSEGFEATNEASLGVSGIPAFEGVAARSMVAVRRTPRRRFSRFEDVLRDAGRDGAGEIRHALLSAVKRFTRNRPPEDDQTLVVLSVGGNVAAGEAAA
jgi:hypothetical protein